jgi:hypothetical protein
VGKISAEKLIHARERESWLNSLRPFTKIDVCHLPEYHEAYSGRISGSNSMMWTYDSEGERLSYPFLLSPVFLRDAEGETEETGYFDLTGIYGYSGPLSTTSDAAFLQRAWQAFDIWARSQKVICEFLRFSTYVDNSRWAHPDCGIEVNRPISYSILPRSGDAYFETLHSKTRNLIRRAAKEGLVARLLNAREGLSEFRALYRETMARNQAPEFFDYNDAYYDKLLTLSQSEVLLCGVYDGSKMVSAAMGLAHGKYALYHLGASLAEVSGVGAGNLVLFELAKALIERDVSFFNIGGGRTTASGDPLFSFKKSNGNCIGEFRIGKRVIDRSGYDSMARRWKASHGADLVQGILQFYR